MIIMLEKEDPKVLEFRQLVFTQDLKLPIEVMDYDHKSLKKITKDREHLENAWKLSNTKFLNENIDKAWLIPGVGISCGVDYDNERYRGGYLTYTLKEKRAKYRSLNFKEFGFMTLQSVRAIELGKKEIFLSLYEYNKRMSAQLRAYHHKGYADIAGNVLHQDLEYRGLEKVREVDQHVFAINFEKLWKKYDPQLLEMNNDEAPEVTAKYPTDIRKYPDVLRLYPHISSKELMQLKNEYKEFNDNENYILSRRKDFVISPSINIILINYLGFREKVYQGISLNKKGTTELKDKVGSFTKRFLSQFTDGCRFNYITTRKGWKTKQHSDHEDYTKQGFRIIIPFDEMKMTFDSEREYILSPGFVYFVNVCIPHVGEHYSELDERAGILFKLNSDKRIWQALSFAASPNTA